MPTCPGGAGTSSRLWEAPSVLGAPSLGAAASPAHGPGKVGEAPGKPEPNAVRVQPRRCQRAGSPTLHLRAAPASPPRPLPSVGNYRERTPRELGGHRRARRPRSVPDQPVRKRPTNFFASRATHTDGLWGAARMLIHPGDSPIISRAWQGLHQWFPGGAGTMQILLSFRRNPSAGRARTWCRSGLLQRRGRNQRASWQGGGAQRPSKQAPELRTKRKASVRCPYTTF